MEVLTHFLKKKSGDHWRSKESFRATNHLSHEKKLIAWTVWSYTTSLKPLGYCKIFDWFENPIIYQPFFIYMYIHIYIYMGMCIMELS